MYKARLVDLVMDWLTDFTSACQNTEAGPRVMYWVGVVTLAGALRRKVWIDQGTFQWTPNFYVLLVGPPGEIKKSTSINIGLNLLHKVPGIHHGPQTSTWQGILKYMSEHCEWWGMPDGSEFPMSCVTLGLSEFGTFFDPDDQRMIDNLTDLYDAKIGIARKMTVKEGLQEIENPWPNLFACTTPKWVLENLSELFVGGGLASRFLYLYQERAHEDIHYPKRHPKAADKETWNALLAQLTQLSQLAGEMDLTEEAYEWGTQWNVALKHRLRTVAAESEKNFLARGQTHLHKLAIVVACSKGHFPCIELEDLQEAAEKLAGLEEDASVVFGRIGQTSGAQTANEIVDILHRTGPLRKRELWQRAFFRKKDFADFEKALKGAIEAGLVVALGEDWNPLLKVKI